MYKNIWFPILIFICSDIFSSVVHRVSYNMVYLLLWNKKLRDKRSTTKDTLAAKIFTPQALIFWSRKTTCKQREYCKSIFFWKKTTKKTAIPCWFKHSLSPGLNTAFPPPCFYIFSDLMLQIIFHICMYILPHVLEKWLDTEGNHSLRKLDFCFKHDPHIIK